jgi:hypothetical protein
MPIIREHVRLHAFPQADRARHHLLDPDPDGEGTVLLRRDDSEIAHDCATCGVPLLEGCRLDRLPGVVFGCRACGGYSVP